MSEAVLQQIETAKVAHLYPCEMEVLYWAAQGKTSWETAMILELKGNTIFTYRKEAIKKLSASNITNAVWLATKIGLVSYQ